MCDIINSTKGAGDMENVNIVLAANILKYRKKSGLSQEELANKLGVTFQAVSKWENAKAAPDISFLPIMADIFDCYIDELFSREIKTEIHYDHCPEFPWADDTVIKPKYTNSKGTSGKQINADIMRLKAHFSEYEINLTDRPAKMELQLLLTASLKRDSAINISGKTTVLFKHLDRFISEESLAGQWAYSTIRCWNTFRGHLAKFNPFITYDCFDEDGINQFLAFLRYEQKLTEKTVKKIYTHLKWFLGWAIRKRLCKETTINIYRPKFKVLEKPVIFLTKEELLKLYHFPIPPRGTVVNLRDFEGRRYTKTVKCREALIKTRDLFCFCAFTSLRYSDMAKVRRTDINGNYLYVTTQKTNDRIPIDLNAFAKEIIHKYKNRHFPEGLALPVISNQRMNRHLKELCELCGFNEPISRVYFRSGQRIYT